MNDKSLKNKAINIKGKSYVLVSDRVIAFNELFPKGSIQTDLLSDLNSEMVVVRATIYPDSDNSNRKFTGYSQAKWNDGYINKTSALENCETSAVGRALAMMGIGVIDSIASVDEINKANTHTGFKPQAITPEQKLLIKQFSQAQQEWIESETGKQTDQLTILEANKYIELIQKRNAKS